MNEEQLQFCLEFIKSLRMEMDNPVRVSEGLALLEKYVEKHLEILLCVSQCNIFFD